MERALTFMPTDVRNATIHSVPSVVRNGMNDLSSGEADQDPNELNDEIIEVSDTSDDDQMNTSEQVQTNLRVSLPDNLSMTEELKQTMHTPHQEFNEPNATLDVPNVLAPIAQNDGQHESSIGIISDVSMFLTGELNASSQQHFMCYEPIDANIKFNSFDLTLLKDQMNMCIEAKTSFKNQVMYDYSPLGASFTTLWFQGLSRVAQPNHPCKKEIRRLPIVCLL